MNDNSVAVRVPILDKALVERKLSRMAWQIWEHNSNRESVTLVGIAGNGLLLAEKLAALVREISPLRVTTVGLEINKRAPLDTEIRLSAALSDESLVLVDDVANSGKTLLYALRPLMDASPAKILIAVLVERKHKSFPVAPDIIGQRVATTLQEHIMVTIDGDNIEAFLE